jgi:hypothetical protein
MTEPTDLWGCAAAVLGVCAIFSLMQLRRGQTGWVALIGFVFFLWRVSAGVHWWAIAAFFGAAIVAGSLNVLLLRRFGREAAPALASAINGLAVVCFLTVAVLMAMLR